MLLPPPPPVQLQHQTHAEQVPALQQRGVRCVPCHALQQLRLAAAVAHDASSVMAWALQHVVALPRLPSQRQLPPVLLLHHEEGGRRRHE